MSSNYLPSSDADFDIWQQNFYTYVNAHLAELGLTAADLAPLTAAQTSWQNAFSSHITAQAAALGARQGKDTARDSFEFLTRAFVRRVQAIPTMTDAARASMNITVAQDRAPATPPTTRPVPAVLNCIYVCNTYVRTLCVDSTHTMYVQLYLASVMVITVITDSYDVQRLVGSGRCGGVARLLRRPTTV
ncbi:MAG: hypothetical protein QOH63_2375 [Acidobacteriota bacterium]|jgi:hypothetical protein|nr:hypothetical protein [Acidobacteriota bacterium]